MVSARITVRQCRDWCCEDKPHNRRWWNVSIAPGNYDSVDSFRLAMHLAGYRVARMTT